MQQKISKTIKALNWQRLLPGQFRFSSTKRSRPTGRIAVAYWDRENVSYLVIVQKANQTIIQDWGSVSHLDHPHPLAALGDHFRQKPIDTNQLLVLLSRSEVEVLTLSLPPADAAELPSMVLSEAEQQLGESESAPIVDYFCLTEDTSNRELNDEENQEQQWQKLLAFSLNQSKLDQMQQHAAQAGLRLAAVGFRQLSAINQLLRLKTLKTDCLNISLQVYLGEVELAIFAGQHPLILRSVRVNLDDIFRVAEQLAIEVERCTTLLPPEHEDLPRHWIVDGCSESAWQLAQALADSVPSSVDIIQTRSSAARGQLADTYYVTGTDTILKRDPESAGIQVDELADTGQPAEASSPLSWGPSIALGGALLDHLQDGLPVDFTRPKQPPAPPNPWVRPAIWTVGGATAAAVVGVMLMGDVWQLQEDVRDMESRLAEAQKIQGKTQEKADQVQLVEQWLSDQVDWLTALSEVSQRLPDGKNATVRRLTASTNGSEGVFDLSVQVRQPEDISVLESQLRSVKYSVSSKRISQAPDASEYPWRFETRIAFPIEPIPWSLFVPSRAVETGEAEVLAPKVEPPSSEVAAKEGFQ